MRLCILALTGRGAGLAREIKSRITAEGHAVKMYIGGGFACGEAGEHRIEGTLPALVGSLFDRCDGLVFIMAVGIAVRVIAPHLKDKRRDPAVVVMDERGQFAISLLSGHLGGANRLAETLARVTGAAPVITTASDVSRTIALDVLAQEKGWRIEDEAQLKKASSALVNGKRTAVVVDDVSYLNEYNLPQNIELLKIDDQVSWEGYEAAVFITSWTDIPALKAPTLVIRPRTVTVGVGCRRGAGKEPINAAVENGLKKAGRSILAVKCLATIDLKHDEAGLLAAAEELDLPIAFIGRQKIAEIENSFPVSPRVRSRVGVGAVCEPAAYLAGKNSRRVLGKTIFNGVAVAVYEDIE